MKPYYLLIFALSFPFKGYNQGTRVDLQMAFEKEQTERVLRVNEYLKAHPGPKRWMSAEGNAIEIVDIDHFGKAILVSTVNSGAAASVGVNALRIGGGLGLDLTGSGIHVGVWDSGPAFDHVEFGTRLIYKEAGTTSDHGTHVAGSILASGINANAMGMAPKATLSSYDWNSDRVEMIAAAKPDQTGLLFSNHSYGIILGWHCTGGSCTWYGTPSISDKEDWRFGFYSSTARDLDQIAFNSPYYSIFWAAGNDRDDYQLVGQATYPQDGNQGSGYDCIALEGTAKNIFTIGAVRKLTNYTSPGSVEMTGFSNWGPTDDGRIKPDLVAPGASIFSTVGGNAYGNLSGTSMATPVATGSMVLLQELYKDLYGSFMRSSTLKALAIHTAREAGPFPGPDYSYGWGLVDAEAAAKTLLGKDNQNVFIDELTLENGQKFELILNPKVNTKITATIAWTDPAGPTLAPSLDPTTQILVNDLDLRLLDDAGVSQYPWALNPTVDRLGEPAFKADNSRDNVEKLEFDNAQARPYKLQVTHKGSLVGSRQAFSLVITYTSLVDSRVSYYWVGGSGNWDDARHWSATSGGVGGVGVPNENSRVVVDENSLAGASSINMTGNQKAGSFVWLNKSGGKLSMNGYTLELAGNFVTGPGMTLDTGGTLLIRSTSATTHEFIGTNSDLSKMAVVCDVPVSKVEFIGSSIIGGLLVKSGTVTIQKTEVAIQEIVLEASSTLNLSGSKVRKIKKFSALDNSTVVSPNATLELDQGAMLSLPGRSIKGRVIARGKGIAMSGGSLVNNLMVDGEFLFDGNNTVDTLSVSAGSALLLKAGSTQKMSSLVTFDSTAESPISIVSQTSVATLEFSGRVKLCYDHLRVTGITVTGDAVVNAGLGSTLTNALNWSKDDCRNILFPDFDVPSVCSNSIAELTDKSTGLIEKWKWEVKPDALVGNSQAPNTKIVFPGPGSYEVRLSVSNSKEIRSFKSVVQVKSNTVPANQVVVNGFNLFSTEPSLAYQWYNGLEPIANATQRSYAFNGEPGNYSVMTYNEECGRQSNVIVITSVADEFDSSLLYPNPAKKQVTVDCGDKSFRLAVFDVVGRVIHQFEGRGSSILDTSAWPPGVYMMDIATDDQRLFRKKLIIE